MRYLPLLVSFALFAACGDDRSGDGNSGEDHAAHAPRMGGRLVDLDHVVQVEFVHDPKAGTLAAYVWDGHVEKAVPVDQQRLDVRLDPVGTPLVLERVSSELLGERFEVKSPLLEGTAPTGGTLVELRAMGKTWKAVQFRLGADEE